MSYTVSFGKKHNFFILGFIPEDVPEELTWCISTTFDDTNIVNSFNLAVIGMLYFW